MSIIKLYFLLFFLLIFSCKPKQDVTKIAFGSCGNQEEPQPILSLVADYKPDAFIYLGDNIYGDTDNMDTLKAKYNRLAAKEEFKKLKNATKIFAIWDDHDFGRNDAGKWYPFKKEVKDIFLDFFKEPKNSPRYTHDGIYNAEYLKVGDKVVQILLLDVRTFRSNLLPFDNKSAQRANYFYDLDYKPHVSTDSTLLGAQQWQWLENEITKPADLRLICSGSQFGIEFNGYEAWANFPHEQQKMIKMLTSKKVNGALFLTGDVHYSEISKLTPPNLYPLYDVTASGITSTWDFPTRNKNRIEGPIMDNHFGLLTITWAEKPSIKMEIIDKSDNHRIEHTILLDELKIK
jgi:alkaline phosphatase D